MENSIFIGEKEYILSPLTTKGFRDLVSFCKNTKIRELNRRKKELDMPDSIYYELYKKAYEEIDKDDRSENQIMNEDVFKNKKMETVLFYLYQLLLPKQPELIFEEVLNLTPDSIMNALIAILPEEKKKEAEAKLKAEIEDFQKKNLNL